MTTPAPLTRRSGLRLPDARPVAAPIGEVEALLDDLAPACSAKINPGRVPCVREAEFIVSVVCRCGGYSDLWQHCHGHLLEDLRGWMVPNSLVHLCDGVTVLGVERIRSKPTK